jgi:4'-phosphopantetheinyl transferase
MITIAPDDVHLWAMFDHEQIAESVVNRYRDTILNSEERLREMAYLRAATRRQYVLARALLRTALAQCVGLEPAELFFVTSASGKPSLLEQQAGGGLIEFNISHTSGAIVLGVTQNRKIGVDVERVRARRVSTQALPTFFDDDECEAIMAAPESTRAAVFCRYWTLKESYVKAIGATLPAAMRNVRFALDEGHIEVVCSPMQSPEQWHFRQYQPTGEHLLSLCVEAPVGRTMRFILHQATPHAADNNNDWPLLLDSR